MQVIIKEISTLILQMIQFANLPAARKNNAIKASFVLVQINYISNTELLKFFHNFLQFILTCFY